MNTILYRVIVACDYRQNINTGTKVEVLSRSYRVILLVKTVKLTRSTC